MDKVKPKSTVIRNRQIEAILLSLLCANALAGGCPPNTADYRLNFDAIWSPTTHPVDFPPGPHFSGLVGAVHNGSTALWSVGQLASSGIERMAELGSKTVLIDEVNAAILAGNAESVISGGGVGFSPGSVTVDFSVSQTYPLATVVTMVAPSPDWFVGVSGQPLFQDGNWIDQLSVELHPYDAGTDSGTSYTSSNSDTDPPQPITQIAGFPFLNEGSVGIMGTFSFQRLSATCADSDSDGVGDEMDNCILAVNSDQRDTDGDSIGNVCDTDIAPAANDCMTNFLDLNSMRNAFFSVPGGPDWNPDADFNGDDSVSFLDLALMRSFFFLDPGPSAAGCN